MRWIDQMRWIKQMKWIVYKMDGVSESPVRTPQEDIYPCDALTRLEGGEYDYYYPGLNPWVKTLG